MNNTRQLAQEIAHLVVNEVAQAELPIFTELVSIYFDDPTPPDLTTKPSYNPLAMGLDELLVAITPAVMAVVTHMLTRLSSQQAVLPTDEQNQQSETQQPFSLEAGLQQLLHRIPPDHLRYGELLLYQARLVENIQQTQRYGDTAERQANRFEVIDQLNHLALDVLGESFNVLSGLNGGLGKAQWQQMHHDGFRVARSFGMPEEEAKQITEAVITAVLTVYAGPKDE